MGAERIPARFTGRPLRPLIGQLEIRVLLALIRIEGPLDFSTILEIEPGLVIPLVTLGIVPEIGRTLIEFSLVTIALLE